MNKGQEFSVFKMLIGAGFAVVFLAVIYQAASNVGCPSPSATEIADLSKQAVNFPGKCFEKEVCFDKGDIINSDYFKKSLNLNSMSIEHVSSSSLFTCSGTTECELKHKATFPVRVICSSYSDCRVTLGARCAP